MISGANLYHNKNYSNTIKTCLLKLTSILHLKPTAIIITFVALKSFMDLKAQLAERSGNQCELCGSAIGVQVYEVPPQERSN